MHHLVYYKISMNSIYYINRLSAHSANGHPPGSISSHKKISHQRSRSDATAAIVTSNAFQGVREILSYSSNNRTVHDCVLSQHLTVSRYFDQKFQDGNFLTWAIVSCRESRDLIPNPNSNLVLSLLTVLP